MDSNACGLAAASISSTGSPENNLLDTGTLGWNNIDNHAEYDVEHQSVGVSSGGSIGSQFAGNMANGLLVGGNSSGSASSTTNSAVSGGTITVRDQDKQAQNVDDLSHDVANANPGLDEIFDREKETERLREIQAVGELGSQAADVARAQGDLNGLEEAKKAHPDMSAAELRETDIYKAEMAKYGTGSAIQQGLSAATAAIQGLAGGDISKAIAGGASPYLAEVIHNMTTDPKTGKVNTEANLMAHAVVGAVVAQINGNSALAGASGAAMGEYIAQQLYPDIPRDKLSEEQRQTISALSTLAAGLAGGLTGESSANAVAGAQAGKNSSENNNLSLPKGMADYGQAVASYAQYAQDNNLPPEQVKADMERMVKGDLPEGANITKAIVEGYQDGAVIAGGAYLGAAAGAWEIAAGGAISGSMNAGFQGYDLYQNPLDANGNPRNFNYVNTGAAFATGMLAPGRGVLANTGIAMGSTMFTDGVNNGGAMGGAALGGLLGGGFGKYAPIVLSPVLGSSAGLWSDIGGAFTFESINKATNDVVNKQSKDK